MSYLNSDSFKRLVNEQAIGVNPYFEAHQGPNLYYCHLGQTLLIPKEDVLVDTSRPTDELYRKHHIENHYDLKPGEFVLAETFETFSTDNCHIFRLFNSSSLARLGVSQCAVGMINPGCGKYKPVRVTLELVNNSKNTIRLYATREADKQDKLRWGTEVLKVAVCDHEEVAVSYSDWPGSLYAHDAGVTGSRIGERKLSGEDDL